MSIIDRYIKAVDDTARDETHLLGKQVLALCDQIKIKPVFVSKSPKPNQGDIDYAWRVLGEIGIESGFTKERKIRALQLGLAMLFELAEKDSNPDIRYECRKKFRDMIIAANVLYENGAFDTAKQAAPEIISPSAKIIPFTKNAAPAQIEGLAVDVSAPDEFLTAAFPQQPDPLKTSPLIQPEILPAFVRPEETAAKPPSPFEPQKTAPFEEQWVRPPFQPSPLPFTPPVQPIVQPAVESTAVPSVQPFFDSLAAPAFTARDLGLAVQMIFGMETTRQLAMTVDVFQKNIQAGIDGFIKLSGDNKQSSVWRADYEKSRDIVMAFVNENFKFMALYPEAEAQLPDREKNYARLQFQMLGVVLPALLDVKPAAKIFSFAMNTAAHPETAMHAVSKSAVQDLREWKRNAAAVVFRPNPLRRIAHAFVAAVALVCFAPGSTDAPQAEEAPSYFKTMHAHLAPKVNLKYPKLTPLELRGTTNRMEPLLH